MTDSTGATYTGELYSPAMHPIELKRPYSVCDLAEKIREGIECWDMYECYSTEYGEDVVFEEKYFGVKGLSRAVKGNRYFRVGWNTKEGKYVSFLLPEKRKLCYTGIDKTILADDANWNDFANVVMSYINSDFTLFSTYKTFKRYLNL